MVYERLCEALTNKALIRGIKQASPLAQTSCLEGFHSVLNHFAPKMIAYSYADMYCRYTKISSLQSNASCIGISVIISWVTNYSLILVQNMRVHLQFKIAIAMFCDKMALQVQKCYGCATHDCIIIYRR